MVLSRWCLNKVVEGDEYWSNMLRPYVSRPSFHHSPYSNPYIILFTVIRRM